MMRRILFFAAALAILGLLFLPSANAAAPGTVTITRTTIDDPLLPGRIGRQILSLAWTASADDASVPDTTINTTNYRLNGFYLYTAETDPGSGTAPTALYDITIEDARGADIAGTLLTNRSQTATEIVNFGTAASGFPVVTGNLTVKWANNEVNSATGVLVLNFVAN